MERLYVCRRHRPRPKRHGERRGRMSWHGELAAHRCCDRQARGPADRCLALRGKAAQISDWQDRFCLRLKAAMLMAAVPFSLTTSAALADGIVDEVKAGVLAHDVGFLGNSVEGGADIVGEVLLRSPNFLHIIGAPRPTIGGSANTNGKTNYVYFDMTWTAAVWQLILQQGDGMYVGGVLGGAVHDGK